MKKIGIIGFGNMGAAIAECIKKQFAVFVFERDASKIKDISGVTFCVGIKDLVEKSEWIVLAVKPQDFDHVLQEIKEQVKGKLIISIAAGITTAYIEKLLGKVRVIRVMPNMPAKICKGMSCLCKGKSATDEDLNSVRALFDLLGKTLIVPEKMMDAATAVSGSGPGFFFDFIQGKEIKEAAANFSVLLAAAAKSVGFSKDEANLLAVTTTQGSLALLEIKLSPVELVKQVASKGGTTEAGLEVLHQGGSLNEAVKAAVKRAKKLSRR